MSNALRTATPNPVVAETALRAYPGWTVREYADGTFDAIDTRGVALSPGMSTFREAVAFARSAGTRVDTPAPAPRYVVVADLHGSLLFDERGHARSFATRELAEAALAELVDAPRASYVREL